MSMSMKQYILTELHTDDEVILAYGLNLQIAGRVLDLDSELITLQTARSYTRIVLDSIISYEVLGQQAPPTREDGAAVQETCEPQTAVSTEAAVPVPPAAPDTSSSLSSIPSGPAGPLPPRTGEPPVSTEPDLGKALLEEMDACRAPSLTEVAALLDIRSAAKDLGDRNVLRTIEGILDAIAFADKQQDNVRMDKLRDIAARVRIGAKSYPEAESIFQRLLGGLCLQRGDFTQAEISYAAAGWYKGAIYAAVWGKHPQDLLVYLAGYLRTVEPWEPDLIRLYAEQATAHRDASLLCSCIKEPSISPARMRDLIACALYTARQGGFSIRWTKPDDLFTQENLQAVLAAIPAGWKTVEEPLGASGTSGIPEETSIWHTGCITSFLKDRYGFIREKDAEPNRYFYIRQIKDIDLRQALYYRAWKNLEVRFVYGVGQTGRSASEIELTDRGRIEAKKRLIRCRSPHAPTGEWMHGIINHYNPDTTWGLVTQGNHSYGFYRSAVTDPYLRAYLDDLFEFKETDELEVSFHTALSRNGKTIAKQVEAVNPFPEAQRTTWLEHGDVTPLEAEQWEARQNMPLESIHDPDFPDSPLEPDEDPYPYLSYEALPLWDEKNQSQNIYVPPVRIESPEPVSHVESPLTEELPLEEEPEEIDPVVLDTEASELSMGQYAYDRLAAPDVYEAIDDPLVENGRFLGTPQEAKELLESIVSGPRRPEVKADLLLGMAKLLTVWWGDHEEQRAELSRLDLGPRRARACAGQGLVCLGDCRMAAYAALETGGEFVQADTARYLYLEAMGLLDEPESPDFAAAFCNYITSCFYEQEPMRDLVQTRGLSTSQGLVPLEGTDGAPLSDEAFSYDMIRLLSALRSNGRGRSDSLDSLTQSLERALFQSPYGTSLRKQLKRFGVPDGGPTQMGMLTELRAAAAKIKYREQSLKDALAAQDGGETLLALLEGDWALWMSQTDHARLEKAAGFLPQLEQETDPKRREAVLSSAQALADEIAEWPTQVSYLFLRPELLERCARPAAEDVEPDPEDSVDSLDSFQLF